MYVTSHEQHKLNNMVASVSKELQQQKHFFNSSLFLKKACFISGFGYNIEGDKNACLGNIYDGLASVLFISN